MPVSPGDLGQTAEAIDSVAHVVQVALTPVFLLSGIGTLLNVFNTRLARVADHTEHAAELFDHADPQSADRRLLLTHLRRLQQRRFVLDASVVLGAIGASATCGAAFMLFVGGMRAAEIAAWLYTLFGTALICTVGALMCFLADGMLAWHGLHREGPLPGRKRG